MPDTGAEETNRLQQKATASEHASREVERSRPITERTLSEPMEGMLYVQYSMWGSQPALYHLAYDATEPRFLSEGELINAEWENGKVYFLTERGDIREADPKTGNVEIAFSMQELGKACQGDSTGVPLVSDFSFIASKLVFFAGPCGYDPETGAAITKLYSMDMLTKEPKEIADVTEMVGYGMRILREHVPEGKIWLASIYVDAGYGSGKLYEVDLETREHRVLSELSFEGHCDDEQYGDNTCDEETLRKNEEFERYFPWTEVKKCGPWTWTNGSEITITRHEVSITLPAGGSYVTCIGDE